MNDKFFVAYFDILGYGARVKNKSLQEEFDVQSKLISDCKFINNSKEITKCNIINFSDTFVIYSDDFSRIVRGSLLFMLLSAIREVPYLPVRGAISYGDFLFDKETNIIIGEALREAYSLERNQEWMGCSLASSCFNSGGYKQSFDIFKSKGILVEYNVPLKNDKIEKRYVINMESFGRVWGKETKNMPITRPEFIRNLFINLGEDNKDVLGLDDSATLKLNNTKSFFSYIESIKTQFQV